MTEVDVNRVYLVAVKFPGCLNDPSPAKPTPSVGDWHTKDAEASMRNVCSMHRHVALILHYDPVTHVAVVFLGSTQPRHPQRYVPWQGSPRLPYQTQEVLHIDGGTFPRAEYLNFSHALRVLVIQENEISRATNPGLASVNHLTYHGRDEDEVLQVTLQNGGLETLRSLHALYWGGDRYTFDGSLLQAKGVGGDREGATSSTSSVVSHLAGVASSSQATGATTGDLTELGPGPTQGLGSTSTVAESLFSYKMDEALRWEEMRNQQIDILEGEGDFDLADLPRCVIEAPTTMEGWNHASHGVQYDVLCSP